ncbi:MAG: CPBP family intramembrane glutamic endopeptidase, partial [Pseudomonadota bacterium]
METGKIQINTFIVSLGAVIAVEAVARLGVRGGAHHPMMILGTVRLLEAGLILMIVLIREKGLASIGLSLKGLFPGLRRGWVWSAGFGLVVLLGGVLAYVMGINPLSLIHTPLPADPGHILLFFIVGGLIGPLTEEIFFRGVLYGFFRRWGALAAILLSTLAFVLAHPVFPAIPITQVVGGLLFAVAYEIEKNLMAPITIHV